MALNRGLAPFDRPVSALLVVLFAVVAIWNAAEYPPVGGYDAAEHIAYAHDLVDDWSLPETGASYTPPGFYLLAGGATRIGEWLDLRILARTPMALFTGTYKGETGGWKT